MSDALVKAFEADQTEDNLIALVDALRSRNKIEEAREYRLKYIEQFTLSEKSWLSWLSDEYKPEGEQYEVYKALIDMAISDFPLSVELHRFKIEHTPESEKIDVIKASLEHIGAFDNELWDEYRKLDPDHKNDIYRQQLLLPVPNYKAILSSFNASLMMNGEPLFDPPPKTKEIVELLKMHHNDWKSPSGSLMIVDKIPEIAMFEHALVYHPNFPTLWFKYLNKFGTYKLAARAVRSCPDSGILWAYRARLTGNDGQNENFNGFSYITNINEAQILLGQLITIDKDPVTLIEKAIQLPIFSHANNWIWPTFLLLQYLKTHNGSIEKQKQIYEDSIQKNSQNLELWTEYIEFAYEKFGVDEARSLYNKASHELKVNLVNLMSRWQIFESVHGDHYNDVLIRMNEIASEQQLETPKEETSRLYNNRTIFVANLPPNVDEQSLQNMFKEAGEIEEIRLKKNFAFIQFAKREATLAAIEKFAGAMLYGNKLDVKPHREEKKFTFFIRYDRNVTPGDLISFIKEKSKIQKLSFRLMNAKKGSESQTKGTGFIDVTTEQDGMKLLNVNGIILGRSPLKIEASLRQQKDAHYEKKQKLMNNPPPPVKDTKELDDKLRDFFGLA